MTELLHADLTYQLRGLAFHIHNELRGGHNEAVYDIALRYALESAGVPFSPQPKYLIHYREQQVGEFYPDFTLSDGRVLIELKAALKIEPLHKAQTISYLAVTQAELGIIMNFGATSMQIARVPNFLGQRLVEAKAPPVSEGSELLYPELCNAIINAMMQVQASLGPGFLHQVYRRAARVELAHRQIGHRYLKELPLRYNGHVIKMTPSRLFLVEGKVLLATVAMKAITSTETERLRWALGVTKTRLGLIANFYGTTLTSHFVRAGEKTTTDSESNG